MVTPSEQMFSASVPFGEVLLFPMRGHGAQSPTLSHPLPRRPPTLVEHSCPSAAGAACWPPQPGESCQGVRASLPGAAHGRRLQGTDIRPGPQAGA